MEGEGMIDRESRYATPSSPLSSESGCRVARSRDPWLPVLNCRRSMHGDELVRTNQSVPLKPIVQGEEVNLSFQEAIDQ